MTLTTAHSPLRAASLLVVGVLLLSGCAAGDEPGSEEAASPVTAEAAPEPDVAESSAAAPDDTASSSPEAEATAETADATAPTTEAEAEAEAEEIVITIVDFAYEMPETVPPGATITVVNEDSAAHTLTSSPAGDFDISLTSGKSGTITAPEEPGEYPIICLFHGNMTATLVVG